MPRPPPPTPKSLLGRHRLLSPTASVRVSPLCLGGLTLGNNWKEVFGECTRETVFELLDTFFDLGGNFIDTSNSYQSGQSEEWIGEWLQKTGHREEMVISTKYTQPYMLQQPVQQSNFGGTGTKSMHLAIETSLKKLQTDYIDLYFFNSWDYATEIPELMQSLNTLVQARKVLYLGISDAPAWVVVKANCYAREHGLRPFSVYQGRFNAAVRDLEREIIPMCLDEGMAIMPWGVLGSRYFQSPDSPPKKEGRNTPALTSGREAQVSQILDVVAKRHNVPITSVAIAYVMQKTPYIFPLIGVRKISHLKPNIEALSFQLTPEDILEIEKGYDFDVGFPHNFVNRSNSGPPGPENVTALRLLGYFDYVKGREAIKPHQGDLNV